LERQERGFQNRELFFNIIAWRIIFSGFI